MNRKEKKRIYINKYMIFPGTKKMVKRIWSENEMIKKIYRGSMISKFGYQSPKMAMKRT